jgi:tRNA threonylcarbamoyladenosine biosynthesis protein TsaB
LKILSITTSSPICGVAILEECNTVKEISLNNGLTHSETLLPIIKQILDETNLQLTDINLLVSDIGPGSFTGIRIGISTLKAFIDSLDIPSIGINSLEALSFNTKNQGIICSLIDAKKDNIYSEIFENIDGNHIIRRNPSFENIDTFLSELKDINPNYAITFIGDGAINYKEKILDYLPNSNFVSQNNLSPVNVGIAGFYNYQKGITPVPQPLYLRKSEAEKKMEEKINASK